MLQFYSKSKLIDDIDCGYSDWRRRLSNFWDKEYIEIDGFKWPSLEHWFQANKFSYKPKYKFYVDKFKKGGTFDVNKRKGYIAKRAGGKGASKKANVVLDPNWDNIKCDIMKKGIVARVKQFTYMKKILNKLKGIHLIHYENARGKESYWGAIVRKTGKVGDIFGKNILGKIYMDIITKI
uniref:NADAR domain-containing protein n=1 Tax=Mimivirus LCMiAC02 TaxID=2506609 RepID=A0A4V1A6G0_9VIRU|nr:MAG: uncharacterized protein LCMiAC02_04980 [Mimivirus LCMiAC02]